MKKIITILSVALLPAVTFAQNYGYRMMEFGNRGYSDFQSSTPIWAFGFLMLIPLIWIVVVVAVFVFWILMLIDAIKNAPEKMKIVWVLVIIFTHIIGALIYYFIEKKPRNLIEAEKKQEEKTK